MSEGGAAAAAITAAHGNNDSDNRRDNHDDHDYDHIGATDADSRADPHDRLRAEEGDGVVFDLQAYLDLLFLHGVAKRIVRQTEAGVEVDTSESLRISPRPQATTPARQVRETKANGARTPRTATPLRGSRRRGPGDEPDPARAVDNQVAPLGPMRVPTSVSLPIIEQEQTPATTDSTKPVLTDFNFFGLR